MTRPAAPPASVPPGSRRTARALAGTALGLLPLAQLFTDLRWVGEAWAAALIVVAPALLLRRRQPPKAWHTGVGVVLLLVWLVNRFVPRHAVGALLPTPAAWRDAAGLLHQVREIASTGAAPVPAVPAITFAIALAAGLLAAAIDLVAVVADRAALTGLALLVIYTLSGAVPRRPVSWLLFLCAATGFLLLLSADSRDTVDRWGQLIPRLGDPRPAARLGVSGPRIAVLAVGAAALVPLLAPTRPSNLLSDSLHRDSGAGNGAGNGIGTDGGVNLDPFAALTGDLRLPRPQNLLQVSIAAGSTGEPFYLRANVLSVYTDQGWRVGEHTGRETLPDTSFGVDPPVSAPGDGDRFSARMTVTGLRDNPPVFARLVGVGNVPLGTAWSRSDQVLLGPAVRRGEVISEQVIQPAPSVAALRAAAPLDPAALRQWLQVPATMPAAVRTLVARITAGRTAEYDRARALSDYFTDPANGFSYSLIVHSGDSGSGLADFLAAKTGYCQQYAAAMGIMLRMAGVPARVVLGYTHAPPDGTGSFTVTTANAHAWVEAYFPAAGWVAFDPTPVAGAAGGATTNLAWAPHPLGAGAAGTEAPGPLAPHPTSTPHAPGPAGARGPAAARAPGPGWPLGIGGAVLVVAAAAAFPAALRRRRRTSRLRAARLGNPEPLWAELCDTAVDLGYVWSAARSPRQTVGWLAPQLPGASPALQRLAGAVEAARYAPPGAPAGRTLAPELVRIEAALRARRGARTRLRSRVLPASIGLRLPRGPRRRGRTRSS